MIYNRDDLKTKKLAELQDIGWQIGAAPTGDRRKPENWIDAIVTKNSTPPPNSKIKQSTKSIKVKALASSFKVGDLVNPVHERWGIEKESLTGVITLIHPSGGVRVNFGAGGTFDYSCPGNALIKKSITDH